MIFRDGEAQRLFGDYPPKSLALFREWPAPPMRTFTPKFKISAFRIKATEARALQRLSRFFYHMRLEFDLQTTERRLQDQ